MPIRALVKKEFRLLVRDRLSAGILIGMPLFFILVLGLLLGEGFGQKPDDRLRVSVVDLDEGPEGTIPPEELPTLVTRLTGLAATPAQAGPWQAAMLLHIESENARNPFPYEPWSRVVVRDLRETA